MGVYDHHLVMKVTSKETIIFLRYSCFTTTTTGALRNVWRLKKNWHVDIEHFSVNLSNHGLSEMQELIKLRKSMKLLCTDLLMSVFCLASFACITLFLWHVTRVR